MRFSLNTFFAGHKNAQKNQNIVVLHEEYRTLLRFEKQDLDSSGITFLNLSR